MILNLLKESKSLIKEDIDLNNPTFKTNFLKIYEITNRDDFTNFLVNGENNTADHFGFTTNNWQEYVEQGKVKPLVITANDGNECIAMMLIWKDTNYQFQIRDGKTINLPISFESTDNEPYHSFIEKYHATLPLYTILTYYNMDFINVGYAHHLTSTDDKADGSYCNEGKLIGIFEELYDCDENGNYIYADYVLPEKLGTGSINNKDRCFSNLDNAPVLNLTWTDETIQFTEGSITDTTNISFNFEGNEELEEKIKNTFNDTVSDIILNVNEEAAQRRAEQRANAERERQEAEDRAEAESFDNAVMELFNIITENDYEYDEKYDTQLSSLRMNYDELTDHQKELCTTKGNLDIAINHQNELKMIKLDNEYKRIAQAFIDDIDLRLINVINKDDYVYNHKIDSEIEDIQRIYDDELSDVVKEKLAVDFDFNYEQTINNIIDIQNRAKENYEANRIKIIQDQNLVIFDNCVVIKVYPTYASVISSRRSANNNEEIYLPNDVNGVKLTRIEKNAFINNSSIKKIYLPETINYIGSYAFYNSHIKIGIPSSILTYPNQREKIKLGKDAIDCNAEYSRSYSNLNDYYKAISWNRNTFSY